MYFGKRKWKDSQTFVISCSFDTMYCRLSMSSNKCTSSTICRLNNRTVRHKPSLHLTIPHCMSTLPITLTAYPVRNNRPTRQQGSLWGPDRDMKCWRPNTDDTMHEQVKGKLILSHLQNAHRIRRRTGTNCEGVTAGTGIRWNRGNRTWLTKLRHSSWQSMTLESHTLKLGTVFIDRVVTWITAVDENGYTLRLASEPPVYLGYEKGCDLDAYGWPWTKTGIPDCSKNNGPTFPCMIIDRVGRTCGQGLWTCATRRTKTNTACNRGRDSCWYKSQHFRLLVGATYFLFSMSWPELESRQPPNQRIPRDSSHGVKGGGAWGSPHTMHLVSRSRTRAAVPPPETYWQHCA
jgi:hypothetical protein